MRPRWPRRYAAREGIGTAGGNIKISPDEMREASTWLQNQKELMQ
ncbi:hypothetical protein [Streptomyces auratus]|nr:hypothetical protein [Streptomyces auratus]